MAKDRQGKLATAGAGHAEPGLGELLARVEAGDQEACRIVYDRFAPHLMRVIRRKYLGKHSPVRRDMDSSDLAQEAWLSMFELVRNGQSLPSEQDFIRLLDGIVRNRFLNHRRAGAALKRSRSREEPFEPALQGRLASVDDPAAGCRGG